jgi:hypothetical protein
MAPPLSQSEIQEITRLLEQGKALPEKYRDILFVDQQSKPSEESTTGREAERTVEPPQLQSNNARPMTAFVKFILDDARVQELIRDCENQVSPRTSYNRNQVSALTTTCVNAIGALLPQIQEQHSGVGGFIARWAKRTVLPVESANELNSIIHEQFRARQNQKALEQRAKEGF